LCRVIYVRGYFRRGSIRYFIVSLVVASATPMLVNTNKTTELDKIDTKRKIIYFKPSNFICVLWNFKCLPCLTLLLFL
jgi:hypothetical protein